MRDSSSTVRDARDPSTDRSLADPRRARTRQARAMDYRAFLRDGLIFASDVRAAGLSLLPLQRAARRGELHRVRRGIYTPIEQWDAADGRARHLLLMRAVVHDAEGEVVFAGVSAAAAWGMPIEGEFPEEVTVVHAPRSGGKSEPGVRRTVVGGRDVEAVERGGLRVTTLARTAIDVARASAFPAAVAVVDWARWIKNPERVGLGELWNEVERAGWRTGRVHVSRAVEYSVELSGSFGESVARVTIILLGFEAPELQVVFRDDEGKIETDFFWRAVRLAGEFDGKVKFTRQEYTHGDPVDVLWREKRREDRLRRLVTGVLRITWDDVRHPARLERLLLDAGVPRTGASARRA